MVRFDRPRLHWWLFVLLLGGLLYRRQITYRSILFNSCMHYTLSVPKKVVDGIVLDQGIVYCKRTTVRRAHGRSHRAFPTCQLLGDKSNNNSKCAVVVSIQFCHNQSHIHYILIRQDDRWRWRDRSIILTITITLTTHSIPFIIGSIRSTVQWYGRHYCCPTRHATSLHPHWHASVPLLTNDIRGYSIKS